MQPVLELHNIFMSYEEEENVLRGVSITIPKGETKIVLGGSGSGKSTILKLILGLEKPDSGHIFVDGEDITYYSEPELMHVRQKIGMVFQEGALFDSLTVGENIVYRLREQRITDEDLIQETIIKLLSFVDLEEDDQYKMPGELSGGMRRRVAIARALVGTPQIMLYDEPTAGLDPITSRHITELMIKLRDIAKVTSIFVTHDLNSALLMARQLAVFDTKTNTVIMESEGDNLCLVNTKFVLLKDGLVIFEGTDEELKASEDPYIKTFLADTGLPGIGKTTSSMI